MVVAVTASDVSSNMNRYEIVVTILEARPPADNESPEVTITSPSDDSEVLAGTNLMIVGTAFDARGVSRLELSLDDGDSWTDITKELSGAAWTYMVSTRTPLLWPDLYTISVRAFDASGNEGIDEISLTLIDRTPPELEILTPGNNARFEPGDTIDVTGYAEDNYQLHRLQVKINDGRRWRDISKNLEVETGSWSAEIDTGDLVEGSNEVTFRITDIYGNEKEENLQVTLVSGPADSDDDGVDSMLEFLFGDVLGLAMIVLFIILFTVVLIFATRKKRNS
jgi:hypothetical protein